MQPETFEDYLKEQHYNNFPQLLDDDLSDHYDDWLGTLDVQEVIDFAEDMVRKIRKNINEVK